MSILILTPEEDRQLLAQVATLEVQEREEVMQIVTSWMRQGIQQGVQQGVQQGKQELVARLLTRRFGSLDSGLEKQIAQLSNENIDSLAEALLDFSDFADARAWLSSHNRT